MTAPTGPLERWFADRGWEPFAWQRRVWAAQLEGASGLVHVATGAGKTLAAAGGPLLEAVAEGGGGSARAPRVVWITPLRALARDLVVALQDVADGLGTGWRVEMRTGDTPSSRKTRQRRDPPEVLVTTPESLTILLSYADHRRAFGGLDTVVVDEWHELMGTKRGVQAELALARLRRLRPQLRTWGLSATLANLDEALAALLGTEGEGCIVEGPPQAPPRIETLVPPRPERFPWAGHLGLQLLEPVLAELDAPGSALLFTNTRSQAERWYRAIVEARPGWSEEVALHHGSLDRAHRRTVEEALSAGRLRCVVSTSTLDLGVDFGPVDRVLQVGSPKGLGRLVQRAGRSEHRPGARSRIVCVPTHALQLAEFAAARRALERGRIEARRPLTAPLDVLCQHVVTMGVGGGFEPDALYEEVRTTHAYRDLGPEAWAWCLDFVSRGGPALQAYPRFRKVEPGGERWRVTSRRIASRHRMGIGTITADGQMEVRFLKGKRLGAIEEAFVGRLRPGDRFVFAGRDLELARVRDMVAYVRLARRKGGVVPRWMGGRLPLSTELSESLLEVLGGPGDAPEPEREALEPLLALQERWSALPAPGRLLLERIRSREGHHLFVHAFLGRPAHEGLASLLAWRLSRLAPRTVRVSANDYGFELLSPDPLPPEAETWRGLLTPERLVDDLIACVNATELARRRFREIARVAGLIFPGFPGSGKTSRQLQASSGLMYDVLARWDADNRLLDQARREVLDNELEVRRLADGLARIRRDDWVWTTPPRLTPLAFPIWAERVQAQVSSESWVDRVRRMAERLEKAAERRVGGRAG